MQQCCLGLKAVWLVYLLSLLGCWLFIREVVPEVRQEVEIDDNNVFAVGLVDAVRDTADHLEGVLVVLQVALQGPLGSACWPTMLQRHPSSGFVSEACRAPCHPAACQ